jgi:hypothetical protein
MFLPLQKELTVPNERLPRGLCEGSLIWTWKNLKRSFFVVLFKVKVFKFMLIMPVDLKSAFQQEPVVQKPVSLTLG